MMKVDRGRGGLLVLLLGTLCLLKRVLARELEAALGRRLDLHFTSIESRKCRLGWG